MEKMESSHTGAPTSADDPALSLRDVLKRLARIDRLPKKKTSVDKLLSLLRAGQIKAGFYFPASKLIWILIPQEYWVGLPKKRVQSLRYSSEESGSGTYEVRITDFVDQYMDAVLQLIDSAASDQGAGVVGELKRALSSSQKRFEVAVRVQDWKDYLERNNIAEPALRETRGRHQKEGWRDLASIIAAYMMTLEKRPKDSRDHDSIARMILQLAEGEKISDLPASDTLADLIAKTFIRAKNLSK
jgi:hypothetical protein